MNVLTLLCDAGRQLDFTFRTVPMIADGAAQHGHLHLLQWLQAQGYKSDERSVCATAARGGQLELLKWARTNNFKMDMLNVCESAAIGGHLEVLKWARANGCEWNLWICAPAALGGHLEVCRCELVLRAYTCVLVSCVRACACVCARVVSVCL